jgi:hypothetical protein
MCRDFSWKDWVWDMTGDQAADGDNNIMVCSTLFERLVNGEFFRVFVACQLFREELIQGL